MRRYFSVLFILSIHFYSWGNPSRNQFVLEHPEVERARGFQEYLEQKRKLMKTQDQGLQIYLEGLEVQAREQERARQEYKMQKKSEIKPELSREYQEHLGERQATRDEKDLLELNYRKEKLVEAQILNQIRLDKMAELGLPENRPRYDLEKRSLYGGQPQFSRSKVPFPNQPSAPNFGSGGSPFPPSQEPFPPAAPFDDFPPPPAFPDDNFDLPPPPPMDPLEGESGTGSDDFFPPPPPPPAFEDNFQF